MSRRSRARASTRRRGRCACTSASSSRICTPPSPRRRRRCSRCEAATPISRAALSTSHPGPRAWPRSSAPPRHVRAPCACTQPSRRSAAPISPSIDGYRLRPPPPPKSPPAPPPPPSPPPRSAPPSPAYTTSLVSAPTVSGPSMRSAERLLVDDRDDSLSRGRQPRSTSSRAPPPAAAPAPSPAASPAASAAPVAAPAAAPAHRDRCERGRAPLATGYGGHGATQHRERRRRLDGGRALGGGRPAVVDGRDDAGGDARRVPAGHTRRLARPPVARGGARVLSAFDPTDAPRLPPPLVQRLSSGRGAHSPLPPNLIPPPLRERTPTQRGLWPVDASPPLAATAADPSLPARRRTAQHRTRPYRKGWTAPPTSAVWRRGYSGVAHSPAPRRPPWRRRLQRHSSRRPMWWRRRLQRRPMWRRRRPPRPPRRRPTLSERSASRRLARRRRRR